MSQCSPLGYTFYRIITHLLIPFSTIPIGIAFYYFSTANLPQKDIELIFDVNITGTWPAIATATVIAPIYYTHCFFNRSEFSKKWQFGIEAVSILLTIAWTYYLCYREDSHFGTWTDESGKLDPIFLFTIPQIITTYIFHWFWVHKYRKVLFLKLFIKSQPYNPPESEDRTFVEKKTDKGRQ